MGSRYSLPDTNTTVTKSRYSLPTETHSPMLTNVSVNKPFGDATPQPKPYIMPTPARPSQVPTTVKAPTYNTMGGLPSTASSFPPVESKRTDLETKFLSQIKPDINGYNGNWANNSINDVVNFITGKPIDEVKPIQPKIMNRIKSGSDGAYNYQVNDEPIAELVVGQDSKNYYVSDDKGKITGYPKHFFIDKIANTQQAIQQAQQQQVKEQGKVNPVTKTLLKSQQTLQKTMGASQQEPTIDTGNKALNLLADVGGTAASFGMPNTIGPNQTGTVAEMKMGLSKLNNISNPLAKKVIQGGIKGIADLTPVSVQQSYLQGLNTKDTAKKAAEDTLIGAAFGAGTGALSHYIGKLKNVLSKPVTELQPTETIELKPIPKTVTPVSKGNFKVKNTAYESAVNDYNTAMEMAQNKFGTDQLRANETPIMKNYLKENGYDIDNIISRMEQSETQTGKNILNRVAETSKYKRVAGLGSEQSTKVSETLKSMPKVEKGTNKDLKSFQQKLFGNDFIEKNIKNPPKESMNANADKLQLELSNLQTKRTSLQLRPQTPEIKNQIDDITKQLNDGYSKLKELKAINPKETVIKQPKIAQNSIKSINPKSIQSNIAEVSQEITPEIKQSMPIEQSKSRFAQQVKYSPKTNSKFAEKIIPPEYEKVVNQDTWDRANESIKSNPEQSAMDILKKDTFKNADDTSQAMALIDKFQKEGKYDLANEVLSHTSGILSKEGQVIQAAAMWNRQTETGMLKYAESALSKARKEIETPKITEMQKEIDNLKKTIDDLKSKKSKVQESIKKEGKTDKLTQLLSDVDERLKVNLQLFAEKQKKLPKQWQNLKLTADDVKYISENMRTFKTATGRQKQVALSRVMQRITDKTPANIVDKVRALRNIALLGNSKTFMRNISGNVLMGTFDNVSNVIGATVLRPLDYAMSKKTGMLSTSLPSIKVQTKGAVKGLGEATSDALGGLSKSELKGLSLKDKAKTILKSAVNPVNTNDINIEGALNGKFETGRKLAFKNSPMRVIENFVNTSLAIGDRPFSTAYKDDIINQLKKANKTNTITPEMEQTSKQVASERTYQDINTINTLMNGIKNLPQRLQNHPRLQKMLQVMADSVIPYAKTPSAILKRGLEYSPAGVAEGLLKLGAGVKDGSLTLMKQREIIDRISRGLLGTGILTGGVIAYNKGAATGARNKDTDVANMELSAGKQPNAIKVGDKYYSYNQLQPISLPFGAGVQSQATKKENSDTISSIADSVSNAINMYSDSASLQSLQRLLDKNKSWGERVLGAAVELPKQFVPTTLKQIQQLTDQNKKETYSPKYIDNNLLNQIKSGIPGNKLPNKVDTLGNPVLQYQGNNNLVNVLVNPTNVTEYKPTEVQKEILRLYDTTGVKTQFPKQVEKYIDYTGPDKKKQRINLSPEEYISYQKTLGELTNDMFTKVINDSAYINSSDEIRAKALTNIIANADKLVKTNMLIQKGAISN